MKVIKKLTYAQLKQMLDDGNAPMEVEYHGSTFMRLGSGNDVKIDGKTINYFTFDQNASDFSNATEDDPIYYVDYDFTQGIDTFT